MHQHSSDQSFFKDPNTVTRTIAGETILVPVRDKAADLNSIFVLNEMGSWIWSKIQEQVSVAHLIESVIAEFDIAEDQAQKDVTDFVSELAQAGLILPAVR